MAKYHCLIGYGMLYDRNTMLNKCTDVLTLILFLQYSSNNYYTYFDPMCYTEPAEKDI